MATLFRDEEVETLLDALDALERSIRARPKNSRGDMDPMDIRSLAIARDLYSRLRLGLPTPGDG